MCELLGLSAAIPTTIGLSFSELRRHGGETDVHADGWGVAYVQDRDALVVREPNAAASSPLAHFVRESTISARIVVSHIRKATGGENSLANTHPFARELGGRTHVFAHNGALRGLQGALRLGRARPVGETDSEHAFCCLLAALEPIWAGPTVPPPEQRIDVIATFARKLAELGPANFLYSDTDLLFAFGHRRPRASDDEPARPGLHRVQRSCAVAGVSIASQGSAQRVAVVATTPLSSEAWDPVPIGELVVLRDGATVTTLRV